VTAIVSIQVPVPQMGPRGYAVRVGPGVVAELPSHLRRAAPRAQRVGVLSDETVFALHGAALLAILHDAGLVPVVHVIPPGEASKSASVLGGCLDAWVAGGLGRTDVAVAFGGGVVGDLGGLAAHLYMRGVPIVQCPTSLLAQVDASTGGKVAIDHGAAKNLIGAFEFPAAVLVDPHWLATLPAHELAGGAAEMVKHGLLFSPDHLDALLRHAPLAADTDPEALAGLVASSVALKAACVAADPFERAPAGRVLLNLGHTVGHALEAASDYALGHGQAVALGLVAAARLSHAQGLAAPELEARVTAVLAALGLPTDLDTWLVDGPIGRVRAALGHDKKRSRDALTYIALRDVGAPQVLSLGVDAILSSITTGAAS
jgi:3-dehydroquinate synthase